MPSAYLQNSELSDYGVPSATAAQIASASAFIDAYLKRPEGLQWSPDSSGFPCYMAALTARLTFTATADIAAGSNIFVPNPLPAGMVSGIFVGEVIVLDRTVTNSVEACVVTNVTTAGFTLQSVKNSHSSGCKMEIGLVVSEQRQMPSKRQITRVASCPIARVHSAAGSYRYGRRSQQMAGQFFDAQFLDLIAGVGGPIPWNLIDLSAASVATDIGEIWIPLGVFLGEYSDVRVNYVAGFDVNSIPPIIKQATAAAINANVNADVLSGGIKMMKAGDTMIQRFGDTVLDADMRRQLDLYRARTVF